MLFSTFYDDKEIIGTLIKGPTSTGLCVIESEGVTVVRHISRLRPMTPAATEAYKKLYDNRDEDE